MKHNLYNMMGLDIYLSSLENDEYNAISSQINDDGHLHLPLMSWDIYSENYAHKLQEDKKVQDILKIKSLAAKHNWQNDIDALFEDHEFEAILVTNLDQNIIWVNDGFTTMTGYSKLEALHKTPRFLQGPKTSKQTKQRISVKLNERQAFKEVIVNYKKDGAPYKCEVKVFPLYADHTTHFIALERQVS